MLPDEITKARDELRRYALELQQGEKDIVAFSRGLVYVLRDAGANASATELERLIFHLDTQTAEFGKLAAAMPTAMLTAMIERLDRPK